jgi:alpha-galactosidase
MTKDEREAPLSETGGGGLSRRHFLGLAGVCTSALAVGRVDGRYLPADGGSPPAARAQRFATQFDREPPFSFVYGGLPSTILLATWRHSRRQRQLDAHRTEHTLTWTDPKTTLVVRSVLVEYHDFPALEWTHHFKNGGSHASLTLGDVLAIDTVFQRTHSSEFVLHLSSGSSASAADYQPFAFTLPANDRRLFACVGGRPTNGAFPYYNIDWGGEGIMAALAWPGQWAIQMTRDAGSALRVQGGMSCLDSSQMKLDATIFDTQLAELSLRPGEEIRTPLIVLHFWQATDWIAAQNMWRRWMMAHNVPRLPLDSPVPMSPTGAVCGYYPGLLDSAADEVLFMNRYVAEHTTITAGGMFDHWWMDAGWYTVPANSSDWTGVGTWQPDPARFPHGLRPVTDRARKYGMKSIVWHEPERVVQDTWLNKNRREWLLGPGPDGQTWLLNLGNPQAWGWVVERFDKLIRDQGVDVYRQDFNMDPLSYWNMGDPPGRRGITQIRHVTGYLAFWDELRRRHPKMLIDSCASGGRRNDLETLRRAVPLLRSDYQFEPTGQQGHTFGLSFWLPYYGTGVGPQSNENGAYGSGEYVMRSSLAPCYASSLDVRTAPTDAWALMRRMTQEWRAIADDLLGDYYPLSDYSEDTGAWTAFQFHRPERGQGVVLAFRRADSTAAAQHFKLRGLQADAIYELKGLGAAGAARVKGRQLMQTGLLVRLAARPAAATIAFRRITS